METTIKQTEKNKQIISELYLECLNKRRWDLLKEIIDENYQGPVPGKGPAAFKGAVENILEAFPDLQFTINDLLAEDNKVVVRWLWEATNENPFRGFRASGKKASVNGIAIFEFGEDKVIRSWLQNEKLELMKQIGAISF